MAKRKTACWDEKRARWFLAVAAFVALSTSGPPAAAQSASAARTWLAVPRAAGRLTARDIGLVINQSDPYSVEVGEFYAQARKLAPEQVLRVDVPVKATLTPEEFESLKRAVEAHFDARTQALALAWTLPYAVGCNSITGALALGYDGDLCAHPCAPSKTSPYFNTRSARPYADFKLRPSMLLAAPDVADAKRLTPA